MHIHIYIFMYICMCTCIYTFKYMHIYARLHIYTLTYILTRSAQPKSSILKVIWFLGLRAYPKSVKLLKERGNENTKKTSTDTCRID